MYSFTVGALVLCSSIVLIDAERIHVHLQPEIVIADYTGPLHKDVLQMFKGAETLEIIDSNITKIHGHMISNLPKLKKMILINCTIDSNNLELDNMFHGATNLKVMIAKNIIAKSFHPEVLRTVPLEILEFTDANYQTLPANYLNETMLKTLIFSRLNLEKLEDGAFNGLDKLETLELESNKLKSVSKNLFAPLKSLKNLKMSGNLFETFAIENLSELPSLEYIDLANNPLKELKLETVKTLAPKLKTIDVTGSSLPPTRIAELKAQFPDIVLKV